MLKKDWKHVLTNAWSVKLMAAAILLTLAEFLLPFYPELIPPLPYALLSMVVTLAALFARLLMQKQFLYGEEDSK